MQTVAKTFYRRPISSVMVPLTTPLGKRIFKESLIDGYMESYFHLSDQFVTQLEPYSCGPSSLAMVLNALEIDPRTQWKGIWRWFSEENINHLPRKDQPLTLSMFTEIALSNFCSVQMFLHKEVEKSHNWNHKIEKCLFHESSTSCSLPEFPVAPKSSSYETFRYTTIALSRVTGCYMILNYDRSSLGQTGSGHFTPLTGFHREQNKALLLDVARFKYPSHWVDLPTIYESMKSTDSQSNLPRGFIIASRSTEMFSDLCRISQDFELMAEFSRFFEQDSQKTILENALGAAGDEQCVRFLDYLMQLPLKYYDLITLFVIQLTYSLETKRNDIGVNLLQEMENVSKKCPAFLYADYSNFDLNKYPILNLFKDYLPNNYNKALCLLSAIFYEELSNKSTIKSSKAIQSCSSYIFL